MTRKIVIKMLLFLCMAFLFSSWNCWLSGNEWVLWGERFVNDQNTVYLDGHGHLIWSFNESLVHYTRDVADRVATQPALQANALLRQYVSELKERHIAGVHWGIYSTTRGSGTRATLLVVPFWYIAALLVAYPAITFIRHTYVNRRRLREHACLHCGYSLIGNVSGVCPECGERI